MKKRNKQPVRKSFFQAYRQAPWRVQLRLIILFSLIVVMIGLVAGVYLDVSARTATVGREIQTLQEEILNLQRQNADLESQLASLTSASAMERRARELGFQPVDPGSVVYLLVPGYPGQQEAVLAPPVSPVVSAEPGLPPEYTQTLLDWLLEFTLEPSNPLEGLFR